MKKSLSLLIIICLVNISFCGVLLQTPPQPPIDPFAGAEGGSEFPIDSIILPLSVLAIFLMVYFVKIKKIII